MRFQNVFCCQCFRAERTLDARNSFVVAFHMTNQTEFAKGQERAKWTLKLKKGCKEEYLFELCQMESI